jgi:hypothetical protein
VPHYSESTSFDHADQPLHHTATERATPPTSDIDPELAEINDSLSDLWLGFQKLCPAAISALNPTIGPNSLTQENMYIDDGCGLGVGEEVSRVSHKNNIFVAETGLGFTGNELKNQQGAPSLITTFYGLVFDFSILLCPTVALEEKKVKEVVHLLKNLVTSAENRTKVTVTELRSLAGKMLRAAMVVKRGKLYVCGLLSLVKIGTNLASAEPGRSVGPYELYVSRWCERNARWWLSYFESCNAPLDFLLPRASFLGDVQGDASGGGFGGLCIVGDTCYFFHGVWTEAELLLLQNGQTLNINYTECLTQLWMLTLFKEHLRGHSVILECDNLWTVNALHEHRARKQAGALLLERIDTIAALNHIEPFFQHIAGVNNRASDALSRTGDTPFFRNIINQTYINSDHTPTITNFVDVSSSLLDVQMRNTEWLSRAVSEAQA